MEIKQVKALKVLKPAEQKLITKDAIHKYSIYFVLYVYWIY